MEVIQIRLKPGQDEGDHGNYFNYEFAIFKSYNNVDFFGPGRPDEDGDLEEVRKNYSIKHGEHKPILTI